MLISMCYLGVAELQSSGMDSLAALGFLVSGICFDKSWEWREQGRSEALCTNTSQWEQVSHQNYKKPTWAFWWRNRTKNDWEGIKESLCIFQLQSDTSLLSYPVTTHSILTEKWNFAVILYVITMNSCNSSAWRETKYWVEFSDHEKLSMYS